MMKNETVVIEQQSSEPPVSLGKSPMSRTLVYRTNKEFDKCAELLRNILTVQESRRNSKPSVGLEINRKSQASPPNINNNNNSNGNNNNNNNNNNTNSTINRMKKPPSKPTATKSFIKTNLNTGTDKIERRSSFSPSKSLLSSTGVSTTAEDQTLLKSRSSPTKSRKHSTRSPSPTSIHHSRLTSPSKTTPIIVNKTRQKSPPSPIRYSQQQNSIQRRRSRPIPRRQDLVRSSSCGDLPSSNLMQKQQTRRVIDQFVQHLTRIRTISKQIRTRTTNSLNDSESFRLWNELESSLTSALTYANDDIQYQLSLEPLRDEMILLRKQLQTTNHHLRHFDHRRSDENRSLSFSSKNSVDYSQLLMENQELKGRCDFLQEKLENIERNNIRLIQRWTQQDLRFHAERTDEITTENRYLLRDEILLLKQKLYHVYDDLATLFNRNHSLEISNAEQKQQIFFYKQQFNDLQQSAQHLLHDLDKRLIEEKIKRFLSQLVDPHSNFSSNNYQSHTTPTKSNPSYFFETPHKATGPPSTIPPATSRSRPTPLTTSTKLRPKSLFVTPTILNDATALSKLQQSRNPDPITLSPSSSSTICDAESILTSSSSSTSLSQQQMKRTTLYTSLPTLNHLTNIEVITNENQLRHRSTCFHPNPNESGPELDLISDLTSKMFSSDDDEDVEEDRGIGDSETSTSSGLPSDAERLIQL